ncbi:low molecular weight protein-tyrosine-phosphatase [Burkholderia sp. IDO3]|uniref:low molecular weight protein-tyrosine-phosphatase n=1 Tax=Burkholderia sp. IDO3 TaxID=1705310 RepID=UPI000BBB5AB5|nr:low molecular weight protein-tyrosine-phosphatase [Burkholderia sp. IDO3]AXK61444.1 low molecular weight phosphotyrosine protein phosphatase [Burkholderia sp. IDO3]PCD62702.1 protein tyrosine phosphatase [Burkholderia sp. IDO3]
MMPVATVLVVCIGNLCRSPMAEALFRARLPGIDVQSAGIGARDGQPADPHAVHLMRARGFDIAAHRTRRLPPALGTRADLILTMDLPQKRWLEQCVPALRGRVFRLGLPDSAAGLPSGFDVPDPYLGPRASFEHSLRLIERGVDAWCARIAPLPSPHSSHSESNR